MRQLKGDVMLLKTDVRQLKGDVRQSKGMSTAATSAHKLAVKKLQ